MNWTLFLFAVLFIAVGVIVEVSKAGGIKNVNWTSIIIRSFGCLLIGAALVYWIDKTIVQTILVGLAVLCVYLVARNNLSFK
jgi:uncharacterized membrane protein